MHQIQLTDQIYHQVKRRADAADFDSVDDYIVDLLSDDSSEYPEAFDHLFTAERLDQIDGVIARVKAGGATHSIDEVRATLEKWELMDGRKSQS